MTQRLADIVAQAALHLAPEDTEALLVALELSASRSRAIRLDRRDTAIRQAFQALPAMGRVSAAKTIHRIWERAGPNVAPRDELEALVFYAATLDGFGKPLSPKTLRKIRRGYRTDPI